MSSGFVRIFSSASLAFALVVITGWRSPHITQKWTVRRKDWGQISTVNIIQFIFILLIPLNQFKSNASIMPHPRQHCYQFERLLSKTHWWGYDACPQKFEFLLLCPSLTFSSIKIEYQADP